MFGTPEEAFQTQEPLHNIFIYVFIYLSIYLSHLSTYLSIYLIS